MAATTETGVEPRAGAANAVEVTRPREGVALLRITSEPLGVLAVPVKQSILAAWAELEADASVRCVVLTGTGRAFSVGSDIREFKQEAGWLLEAEYVERKLNATLRTSRLPVIAACNGATLGGGMALALACDIRLAAESARFGVPEVKVAALCSGGGTQWLPRLVGPGKALHLMLTGEIIDAQEAFRIGLVDRVCPDAELVEQALGLASEIAAQPAAAVAASKQAVNFGLANGLEAGMQRELELMVEVGLTEQAAEGQRAFLEKRAPRFNQPKGSGP